MSVNVLLTDAELISAFRRTNGGRKVYAVVYGHTDTMYTMTASNVKEASHIAREYGNRILHPQSLVTCSVYFMERV